MANEIRNSRTAAVSALIEGDISYITGHSPVVDHTFRPDDASGMISFIQRQEDRRELHIRDLQLTDEQWVRLNSLETLQHGLDHGLITGNEVLYTAGAPILGMALPPHILPPGANRDAIPYVPVRGVDILTNQGKWDELPASTQGQAPQPAEPIVGELIRTGSVFIPPTGDMLLVEGEWDVNTGSVEPPVPDALRGPVTYQDVLAMLAQPLRPAEVSPEQRAAMVDQALGILSELRHQRPHVHFDELGQDAVMRFSSMVAKNPEGVLSADVAPIVFPQYPTLERQSKAVGGLVETPQVLADWRNSGLELAKELVKVPGKRGPGSNKYHLNPDVAFFEQRGFGLTQEEDLPEPTVVSMVEAPVDPPAPAQEVVAPKPVELPYELLKFGQRSGDKRMNVTAAIDALNRGSRPMTDFLPPDLVSHVFDVIVAHGKVLIQTMSERDKRGFIAHLKNISPVPKFEPIKDIDTPRTATFLRGQSVMFVHSLLEAVRDDKMDLETLRRSVGRSVDAMNTTSGGDESEGMSRADKLKQLFVIMNFLTNPKNQNRLEPSQIAEIINLGVADSVMKSRSKDVTLEQGNLLALKDTLFSGAK